MPVLVVSFAQYLTRSEFPWRDDDYNACKFIKAIKGERINGYASVPVGNAIRTLRQANADDAVEWFGEIASAAKVKVMAPAFLVPIPNSDSTVATRVVPRTLALANSLAEVFPNTQVLDCLRFKKTMLSARKGGSRNPQEIYDNLSLTQDVRKKRIILVDDVHTTGAHLRAAAAKITSAGGKCETAVCAGRTALTPEDQPFSMLKQELPDFTPK